MIDMQFTLPSIVEQAKGDVALLLDLREDDSGADRMNSAGGDGDHIAVANRAPLHSVGDGTVFDRSAQFRGRQRMLQSNSNLRAGLRRKNIPSLCFAVRQAE